MAETLTIKTFGETNSASTTVDDTRAAKATANEFEIAIRALEAEATNFGARFINDSKVRADYVKNTKKAVQELIDLVKARKITPHEGAQTANAMRNQIMELARAKTSDFGKALARDLKPKGLGLSTLEETYAKRLYGRTFETLTEVEKKAVWTQIIHKAGQSNPKVNMRVRFFGIAGRALLIATLAVAVYNIVEAEDKPRQTTKEGVTLGTGIAGGLAGATAVGLIVSNPVGWMVGIGIIVGSAIAAIGSSELFDYFWPAH
ncbi:MAG: hypothetical protein HHJ09_13210 [Glaciimonas sp.]|nr:hypothetical protein [Glaciimonas sp.]